MNGQLASPRWKTAQATADHWGLAAKAALEDLGDLPLGTNLGFVYVNQAMGDDLSSIVTFLRETSPIGQWIGGVGFGVLGPQGFVEDMPTLVLMVGDLPAEAIRPFTAFDPDDPEAFWAEHRDWLGMQSNVVAALIHGDPSQPRIAEMIHELAEQTGIYAVGGVTAPGEGLRQVAGKACGGGISGLMLGDGISFLTGLSQGCHPIGPLHRVGEAVENVLMSLDGQPALDVMKDEVGDLIARDLQRAHGYIHVALPLEGSDDPHAYQVRSLLAVDPKRGWLAIGEKVESGQALMFVRRDPQSAQADFSRMLSRLAGRLEGQRIAAGVYVSCLARGVHMFGDPDGEAEMIRSTLGEFPLIGFSAAGEICHDRLYGYTGVLCLFLEGGE